MKFKRWLEKYNKAFLEALEEHARYCDGLKVGDDFKVLIPEGLEKKSVDLFNAYMIQKTNRQLVWATWVLVIGTLILSGLTLYS